MTKIILELIYLILYLLFLPIIDYLSKHYSCVYCISL